MLKVYIMNYNDYETIEEAFDSGAVEEVEVNFNGEYVGIDFRDTMDDVDRILGAAGLKLVYDKKCLKGFIKHPEKEGFMECWEALEWSEKLAGLK